MNIRARFVFLLSVAACLLGHAAFAGVDELALFTISEEYYELKAVNSSVNRILFEMEEVLGVPVGRLSIDRAVPHLHSRSHDMDRVLSSFLESYALVFVYDELGRPFLDAIQVGTSVNTARVEQQYRQQVVRQQRLNVRLPEAGIPRDLVYAGVGAYIQVDESGEFLWLRPMNAQTPAAKAGIELGDQVLSIDGTPVSQFRDQGAVAQAIRGRVGTAVSLVVRKPDGRLINKSVTREIISN